MPAVEEWSMCRDIHIDYFVSYGYRAHKNSIGKEKERKKEQKWMREEWSRIERIVENGCRGRTEARKTRKNYIDIFRIIY